MDPGGALIHNVRFFLKPQHFQMDPLPVIWAAVMNSQPLDPLSASLRRVRYYPAAEWRALMTSQPLDPKEITARLRSALDEAETFVGRMPTDKMGLLFLKDGRVEQPDPGRLEEYQTHAGQRRGQWPTSAEIMAAMFERYKKPPSP